MLFNIFKQDSIILVSELFLLKMNKLFSSIILLIKFSSFLSIMKSIYSVLLPYIKKCEIIGSKEYLEHSGNNNFEFDGDDKIDVKELSINSEYVEEVHYSKERLHVADKEEEEVMRFGTKIHEILEEIDFNNLYFDDLDIDDYMKEKIVSFVNSDFMSDKLNSKMYKEYEFVYEKDNEFLHGIIDLMVEEEDKITIIDYKLKNIDDSLYDEQLNGYREYIKSKTGKEVSCFLYSLLDEKYREVNC